MSRIPSRYTRSQPIAPRANPKIRFTHSIQRGADLKEFYRIVNSAGVILLASNTELARLAQVGDSYPLSVVRDGRRPKLKNFLSLLTAIIEVANERLADVEKVDLSAGGRGETAKSRIIEDHSELLIMALILERLARDEIERIADERPNDPVRVQENQKLTEILSIFMIGFEHIAKSLSDLNSQAEQPIILGNTANIINSVARSVDNWWKKNNQEAIDWAARIPVFAAGVSLLGWAGASMPAATSAIAAIVGGEKVIRAFRRTKQKEV